MLRSALRLSALRLSVFRPSALRAVAAGLALTAPALGGERGTWAGPYPLPLPGVHSLLTAPHGQVLVYSYPVTGSGSDAIRLDPATLTYEPVPIEANIFCGGHGFLEDGRVITVGGTLPGNLGYDGSHMYDGAGFTSMPHMSDGRWYPTVLCLDDGSLLALSGLSSRGGLNASAERYEQDRGWSRIPGARRTLPLYPFAFFMPGGQVFVAGPEHESLSFDPGTGTWLEVAEPLVDHHDGTACRVPGHPTRILMLGGNNGRNRSFADAEMIDLSDPVPAWRAVPPLSLPRHHLNSVILPDGTLLVVGGERFVNRGPVANLRTELFDPETETWTALAPVQTGRKYHSSALLLLDGRVLYSGGDDNYSCEIFSPPYLFQGPRPTVEGVPAEVRLGETFVLRSPEARSIVRAALISPGAVTHSFNQNQRYVDLELLPPGNLPDAARDHARPPLLRLRVPADGTLVPPGMYVLFLVDDRGVPSVGEFLRVMRP